MTAGRLWRLGLLAVIGLLVWWLAGGSELVWPKRFGVVEPGAIYRSGEPTVGATEAVVRRHGIRTIIDLGAHTPGTPEEKLAQRAADSLGVTRYRFGLIGDATGDPNDYVLALRIISDPANQPVWFHCAAGSERTGCLAALYKTIHQGVPLDEAYAESLRYDHDTADNPHLRAMLDRWLPEIRRSYRTGGEIAYDPAADGFGGAGRLEDNGGLIGPFDTLELPEPRSLAAEPGAKDQG